MVFEPQDGCLAMTVSHLSTILRLERVTGQLRTENLQLNTGFALSDYMIWFRVSRWPFGYGFCSDGAFL